VATWAGVSEVIGDDLTDVEFLARGGNGSVFRSRQASLGRVVALKVPDGDPRDGRLSDEARTQAAMSWHGNVVTLLGTTILADDRPALVLEYVPGGTLAERIRRRGALPAADWRRLAAELTSAVAAAHGIGIQHRDIKPSNVLFAADGSCRLGDFGTAGSSTATLDALQASVAYAPPELLDGDRPTPANDVYSLALTLWAAATGTEPFGAGELPAAAVMARVQSERLRFPDGVGGLDTGAVGVLDRCLDPRPGSRPTADELAAVLRGDGSSVSVPASGAAAVAGHRQRAPWRLVAAAGVLLALVGTTLYVADRTQASTPDLCTAYRAYVAARVAALEDVSAELERAADPVDVVDRLLVQFPRDWSRSVSPYLQVAAQHSGTGLVATEAQLAQMTRADVLRGVSGGKPFIYDGESGAFDQSSVPAEAREPARAFSAANALGASRCPGQAVDLAQPKARLYSAIFANLANPAFMDGFFSDPRSFAVIDAPLALLLARMARTFFEDLLDGHWAWFLELLDRDPEVRSALSLEVPDVVLRAGSTDPAYFSERLDAGWRPDLQTGLGRLGPATLDGISRLYPDQLTAVTQGRA
jgi:hypothetical protein